ncbi:sulfotransferase domain-containing protein [Candidatus Pelagibacter sp.]|nr:sulfotransferase domain-containing protein [Candidatus Pelagibacter sp.]
MIIWLASYPKSGNTWVRAFLSSILYSEKGINDFSTLHKIEQFPKKEHFEDLIEDLQNPKKIFENWKNAQNKINLDKNIKLLKTHHVLCKIDNFEFTDNSNSLGVIYVVRDPRTVLLSIKHHFGMKSLNESRDFITNENIWLGINKSEKYKNKSNKVPTLIGSWRVNYLSWKNKIQNYLIVKYEDLLENPQREFFKISKFIEKLMNCKFDEEKIKNAIETTSFQTLQKLEEKGLFTEQGQGARFFNSGPNTDWKTQLDKNIIDEINLKFKNEMVELGYL